MEDIVFEGIGGPLTAVDTPALLGGPRCASAQHPADGRFWARYASVSIRPHAKTHKTSVIAHMQVTAGAIGQCAQKVGEAEILVAGGVKDVLVANEVVGPTKLQRLVTLARQSRITVAVDHPDAVSALAAAARHHDVSVGVVIDVDVGLGRCGVCRVTRLNSASMLNSQLGGVALRGLQGYHGAIQHIHGYGQRAEAARAATTQLQTAVDAFRHAGLPTDVITGAGSGTYEVQGASGLFTEIQPGSYIFMDRQYCEIGGKSGEVYEDFEPALFVLATVMSTPAADRVVLDAGYKALSNDAGTGTSTR